MNNCVYILMCRNGRYYIGSTVNLEKRYQDHSEGLVRATQHLRPLKMVFYQSYSTSKEARQIEYWLKKLKSRIIIEQIIQDQQINKQLR